MQDLWFVFSTFGDMNIKEVVNECQNQSWVPLLILNSHDGSVIVPCFNTQPLAIQFAKRNLPKHHIFGTAKLPHEDVVKLKADWIEGRGWKLENLTHPRKMTNLGSFGVEVHQYIHKPDVYGVWGNDTQNNCAPISLLNSEEEFVS